MPVSPMQLRGCPRRDRQRDPAGEHGDAADRGDHAEPFLAGDAEDVEAPREHERAHAGTTSRPRRAPCRPGRPGPSGRRPAARRHSTSDTASPVWKFAWSRSVERPPGRLPSDVNRSRRPWAPKEPMATARKPQIAPVRSQKLAFIRVGPPRYRCNDGRSLIMAGRGASGCNSPLESAGSSSDSDQPPDHRRGLMTEDDRAGLGGEEQRAGDADQAVGRGQSLGPGPGPRRGRRPCGPSGR